jgi:hypothetical protein
MGHFSPAPSRTPPGGRSSLHRFLSRHNFSRSCFEWTILREPIERVASALFYINHRVDAAHVTDSQLPILLDCLNTTRPRFDGHGCGVTPMKHHKTGFPLARTSNGRGPDYFNDLCRTFGNPPHWNRFEPAYGLRLVSYGLETCDLTTALANLRRLDGIGFVHALQPTLDAWAAALGLGGGGASFSSHRGEGAATDGGSRDGSVPGGGALRGGGTRARSGGSNGTSVSAGVPRLMHVNPSSHAHVAPAALPPQLDAAIRASNRDDSRLWESLVSPCAAACGGAERCAVLLPRAEPKQQQWRCVTSSSE